MLINYDSKNDLLYLRLDSTKQDVVNKRISDEIVLDIGADDKIVGIEFIDASKNFSLKELLPIETQIKKAG